MKLPFRLLPVTVFVAVLMLTLRAGQFWNGLEEMAGSVSISPSRAQTAEEEEATEEDTTEEDAAANGEEETSADDDEMMADDEMMEEDEEEEQEFTEAEVEMLQKLVERRQVLERRSREIEMREGLLEAAEKRVEAKISELKTLQATIEGLIDKYDEQEETNLKSLVKIYESMKPKDAARIFEQLEMTILLEVVSRMSERKVAPVLAKMDPVKAQAVTTEIALRRHFPKGNDELGGLQEEAAPDTGANSGG